MITKLEATRYRCLRFVSQDVRPFNVLVGPNASGKTTFLDVVAFLGDIVRNGPAEAVAKRSDKVHDLFWQGQGTAFEIAAEFSIPGELRENLPGEKYDTARYEIRYGFLDEKQVDHGIIGERVYLKFREPLARQQRVLFPEAHTEQGVFHSGRIPGKRGKSVIHKVHDQNDNFYSEMTPNKGKGWLPSFKFGPQKSALANIPDDGQRFPVSMWLKDVLSQDVQDIVLNSRAIRKASPPGQVRHFMPDGSNLPWVVDQLRHDHPAAFADWVSHVQIAFPDIQAIDVKEREDTKYKHIVVVYAGDVAIPSWMVSDGTLRFLALTLLAYLSDVRGAYLIEEPENGIHPRAIEYLFESLSSVRASQLMLATHSPIAVGLTDLQHLLCFAKSNGATDIVLGNDHPALKEWKREGNLGWLFAAGVLG